jgi:hypothetical protein
MGDRFRSSVATLIVVGMVLSALDLGSAQAAPRQAQVQAAGTYDLSARKRHYHSRNDSRAAIAAFGMVAGTIAGIAAAQESRPYYRGGYYGGYYDYPPPPPAYGYGGYYRGYDPYW